MTESPSEQGLAMAATETAAIMEYLNANWNVNTRRSFDHTPYFTYDSPPLHPALDYQYRFDKAIERNYAQGAVPAFVNAIVLQGINRALIDNDNDKQPLISIINTLRTQEGEQLLDEPKKMPLLSFAEESDRIRAHLKKWDFRAAPRGYSRFSKRSADDLTQEEWDAELPFKGHELTGKMVACASGFGIYMNNANVLYSDKEQGRKPIDTLIGAVLRQGMGIGYTLSDAKYGNLQEETARTRSIRTAELVERLKTDPEARERFRETLALWRTL